MPLLDQGGRAARDLDVLVPHQTARIPGLKKENFKILEDARHSIFQPSSTEAPIIGRAAGEFASRFYFHCRGLNASYRSRTP